MPYQMSCTEFTSSSSKHWASSSVSCGDGVGGYSYTLVKPTSPDLSVYFLPPHLIKSHNAADPATYSFLAFLSLHSQDQISAPILRLCSHQDAHFSSLNSKLFLLWQPCDFHNGDLLKALFLYALPQPSLATGAANASDDRHQADAKDEGAAAVQLCTHAPRAKVT